MIITAVEQEQEEGKYLIKILKRRGRLSIKRTARQRDNAIIERE